MKVCLDQTHPTGSHRSQSLGYQNSDLAAAAAVIDGGKNYQARRWCFFEKDTLDQHQDLFAGRLIIGRIILLVAGNGKCRLTKAGGKEGAVSFELPHQLVVSAHGVVSPSTALPGGETGMSGAGWARATGQ